MKVSNTIVVMVSIGDRTSLTNFTFPRLAEWATKFNYSSILLKTGYNPLDRAPHFNKLQVHKILPNFDKYIIIDDDLLMSTNAPEMEQVPDGFIGLCKDAEQRHTEANHVLWTANTGFIVVDKSGLHLLDKAYEKGEYPYRCEDGSGKGIWGPHDQGILNDIVFREERIYELSYKWNYQPILDYFINDQGWYKWMSSKTYRLSYYASLLSPFSNKNKTKISNAYGLHLIRGTYPKFFSRIFK
ncbi:hypothetical protein [Pedobacter sp. R20-19]|uniref:hypothetical protein n=1 Tax=Pedobacter sp. R20-19 TaxID=1270196 RepID=UPI0004937AB8|nr:hypothetical protein [Pedobacter sp. R20-19]